MKKKSLYTLALILTLLGQNAIGQDKIIYVSPNTNGEGTKANPASLEATIELLPAVVKQIESQKINNYKIAIKLLDGTYELNKPIVIDEKYSNDRVSIEFLAAEGAIPILSGGRNVQLKNNKNGVLEGDINGLSVGDVSLNDFYVGGKRATRARYPNYNVLKLKGAAQKKIDVDSLGHDVYWQAFEIDEGLYGKLKALSKEELLKTGILIYTKWITTYRKIDSIDKVRSVVYAHGEDWKDWRKINTTSRYFIENLPNGLDSTGEWMSYNKDIIRYHSGSKEIEELTGTLPVLDHLLLIKGKEEDEDITPVQNISFKGITFQYTKHPPYKNRNEFAPQAASSIDAAIIIDNATNIQFTNCTMAHTGQYGIWFRKNVRHSGIAKSYLTDLGAGGVRIGDNVLPDNVIEYTNNITVSNNIIHSGGYNYPEAVGILLTHAANNIMTHNDIADFRYSGITVGWIWGYSYSPSFNNEVSFNHIHHLGHGMLSDIGGIYTLGVSPGTRVFNNVIHDIYSYSYGGWGIYTDQASTYIRVYNNLVYNMKNAAFHQNIGRDNNLYNNIFAFGGDRIIRTSTRHKYNSFDFKHNIVLSDGVPLLFGTLLDNGIDIDSNLYWSLKPLKNDFAVSAASTDGGEGFPPIDSLSWQTWQQESSMDQHSYYENPGFKNPKGHDFSFVNTQNKYFKAIGFIPFDYSKAGVLQDDKNWVEKSQLPIEIINQFNRDVKTFMGTSSSETDPEVIKKLGAK